MLLFAAALPAQSGSAALRKLCDDYTEFIYKSYPASATAAGRNEYNHQWQDLSPAAIESRRRTEGAFRERLRAIPANSLTGEDRITAKLLDRTLEQSPESERFGEMLLSAGQMYGLHNRVMSSITAMPARTQRDYENIIARINTLPVLIDQHIALLDRAVAEGLTQPRPVLDRVLPQLDSQLAPDAAHSPLLAAFGRFPDSIPPAVRQSLTERATAAYENRFRPAWKKYRTYMAQTYATKIRKTDGVASVPDGAAIYRFQVRSITTTNLTPEEIHRLGEQEVSRIEAEMQAIARQTGFTGTVQEFQAKLHADSGQHFESKEEMLAFCRNIAKKVEPELPRLFQNIPWLLYGIRAIPEDREASSASNAEGAALDRSRPGWFNLNTYQPEAQIRYNKESLVLHEAIPGHLLQGAYAGALDNLPTFRKTYSATAYAEGWGLYAESLGADLGLYRDPYTRFGQLSSECFRAVRLVVDTGIHAMGWTRERAIQYSRAHPGDMSVAEIDRYISWPGQALAYKIGQLKFLELRKLAQEKLGPKFDIREFHSACLRHGRLPMDILEEEVRAYIDEVKGRS